MLIRGNFHVFQTVAIATLMAVSVFAPRGGAQSGLFSG